MIFIYHNPPGLEGSSCPFPSPRQLCLISSSQQWDLLTQPVQKKYIPVRNDHTFPQCFPQVGFTKNSRVVLSCHYKTTRPISSLKKAGKISESRFSLCWCMPFLKLYLATVTPDVWLFWGVMCLWRLKKMQHSKLKNKIRQDGNWLTTAHLNCQIRFQFPVSFQQGSSC